MGIAYRAVAAFGIQFKTLEEVNGYLEKHGIEEELEHDLSEDELGLVCLNDYSGENWILGYEVELGIHLDVYRNQWKEKFPNAPYAAKPLLKVKVY